MFEKCTVDVLGHSLDSIRYAAYTQTDIAWVYIAQPDANGKVELTFKLKQENCSVNVCENFMRALADEKIREKSSSENIEATKLILNKVMTSTSVTDSSQSEDSSVSALTKEQEQELDALIAEVEKELQAEVSNMKKDDDPQNITKTWEEMNKEEK